MAEMKIKLEKFHGEWNYTIHPRGKKPKKSVKSERALNNATSELIMQFNKTFTPGTHLIYISHKTGLAFKVNKFDAKNGEGVDTLQWTTENEFGNLGFNNYRRIASAEAQISPPMTPPNSPWPKPKLPKPNSISRLMPPPRIQLLIP